jgi:putative RecB family exonuclease
MRSLSFSQVSQYLGCPLKYRFQYVDQIPRPWRAAAMAFGTSVHAAIEWFHRERMDGHSPEASKAIEVFEADWFAQNVEPLVFSEWEDSEVLREKGIALLAKYLTAMAESKPAVVESPFELDLYDPETGEDLGVRFHGFIDLVEEGDTLVDVKTAGRRPENGGLERHLQLSTYALVFYLLHGKIPDLRLDVLLKLKSPAIEQYRTTRSLPDLSWTSRLIERTARAIEQGHFFPNPSWRCGECEYFAHCQSWRGP